MKILVTGATGLVGQQLLPLLAAAGHDINVLTRDPKTAVARLPVRCRRYKWDPALLEPPKEALEGVDAVINLAGENIAARWTDSKKAELERSRVLSTHQLVKAMEDMEARPRVFVSCSGIGYYGDRKSLELDESVSGGNGVLADVCKKWEAEALKAESLGVRTVVLRIATVLGTDGGALKFMLPAFRMCVGGRVGSGRQWMSWIHVRDLARLMLHAVETESLRGPVNATSPEPVTNAEFTRTLAKAVHRPAFLPMPAFLLKLVVGEMSGVLLDSQKAVPKKAEACGFRFDYPELEGTLVNLCDVHTHALRMEQWVPQPLNTMFEFYSDAKNLEVLTPPFLNFQVLGQSTRQMEEGTRINYRLQLYGIPFRWQSVIMDWKSGRRFSDIQVVGPYWLWHHTHEFIEQDGGTLIRDCAIYRVPLWTLGELLIYPVVRRDLEKIFAFRWQKTCDLFGE
ncbi:TIGR01777 family oxidoreductase [Nitrospina watsonii]|uniref:Cell division inhibitor SULA n=1 Tax=Nitrospina watsonii TaxID=1323948 RepID=A0ABN8W2I7_9BACT|nr:TIGR01777 family oxidoreductase [Nitrospina watsonii]CAI2719214.1 Cell division inhibitor SULA [Nitrospina watsonii]